MPGPPAIPADELDGPGVRRLTRQSTRLRADTTLMARLGDTWSVLLSVAIGFAIADGWLASIRESIATRPPVPGTALPGAVTTAVVAAVALAGLISLCTRLGPVSVGPAAVAWWLPLPADRRGLLRGELFRLAGAAAVVTATIAVPLTVILSDQPSLLLVATWSVASVSAAVALIGAVAFLQTRRRTAGLAAVAGAVAVGISAVAATLAAAPELARTASSLLSGAAPPAVPLWAGGTAAVALVLLLVAERGLGRLDAGPLRAVGATSEYATASALSLDTRDLGRALGSRHLRPPARSRRFRRVSRPWQSIVAADLLLLARSPWQAGQLVVATAVPVLAARTEGIDRLPLAVWAGLVVGWLSAAVAVGHPSRHAQVAPALDRLLPLSPGQVVAARCVAPALVLSLVCAASGLLIGSGRGSPLAWAALAVAVVPAWTAAALRGAYRPELDWSGPVVSSPMGALPVGIGATLLNGIDVGLIGSAPLVVALVLGGPPSPVLIGGAFLWAGLVAGAALALLARRERLPE